jgi:rhodanese-related sulfurtransferase
VIRPDPKDPGRIAPLRPTRRGFIVLGVVAAATVVGAARWFNVLGDNAGQSALSPPEAHAAARDGTLLLVDVRRPDEWAGTGIGAGALPLDMRRPDFEAALLDAAGGDRSQPIALICARGVRSRSLSARLRDAGFTNVMDVPEGMLGSGAGPGWLRRGLPVVPPRRIE